MSSSKNEIVERQKAPLRTPSDIDPRAVKEISGALNALLADVFLLYLKSKNFDWHVRGPHFRDYHLLLDDHADQIFAMTDDIVLEPPSGAGIASRSKRGPLSKSSTTQTFEDAVE
jgi:starvation-inducible DNA-binding protein